MNGHVDQNGAPKTLYVGNLDNSITEDLIVAVFGQVSLVSPKSNLLPCKNPHSPHLFLYVLMRVSTI